MTNQEHSSEKIALDLRALAEQLVASYYKGGDQERAAELRNALDQALRRLAKRLSNGEKVSLRLVAPQRPQIEPDRAPSADEQQRIAEVQRLSELSEEVKADTLQLSDLSASADVAQSLPAPEGPGQEATHVANT